MAGGALFILFAIAALSSRAPPPTEAPTAPANGIAPGVAPDGASGGPPGTKGQKGGEIFWTTTPERVETVTERIWYQEPGYLREL